MENKGLWLADGGVVWDQADIIWVGYRLWNVTNQFKRGRLYHLKDTGFILIFHFEEF